jgi:hypothetical protein
MIRARIFAISCGYEDADDPDFLRTDRSSSPTGGCPTLARLENAPSVKDAIRLT